MSTELGKAYVQIVPSADGISGAISKILTPEATLAGQNAGSTIGTQIASFATKAIAALGVGKMISDAITNGMDFEGSMTKASTLFSGTKEELAGLQSELINISSSTGMAAAELAEAAYSAESASVPMGNLGSMIQNSAKLAVAGFTDTDTALSATAKTMNAYGMMSDDVAKTQENLEKVQRILIQTQNKGITTVGELGASLAQVTPTAASFGVSFEQVGASLAGMTAQGTPTAQATTQLNSLIAELAKNGTTAAKNLAEAAEGTEYAGMSFTEMMENGADLNDVLDLMKKSADANGLSMVDMFSSIEAGKAALSINNSDWEGNMQAMATDADVVGEAYSTMADTVGFKANQIKTSLTNMGIEAFSASADFMIGALDGISKGFEIVKPSIETLGTSFGNLFAAINEYVGNSLGLGEDFSLAEEAANLLAEGITMLSDGINFLTENMDTIAPIVEAVVAGFLAFQAVQFVIGFIQGVTSAFGLLSAAMMANPIGLVVGAIAALVAGLVVLYNNCETFRLFVDSVWGGIKQFATDIATFFTGIGDTAKQTLDNMSANISEGWNSIKSFCSETWNNIKNTAATTWDSMKNTLSTTWNNMKSDTTTKWNEMKTTLNTTYENMKTLSATALSVMKENLITNLSNMKNEYDSHGGGMKGIAAAMWEGLTGAYKSGFDTLDTLTDGKLSEIYDAFTGKFHELISDAWDWGSDIVHGIADGISSAIDAVVDAASGVADAIWSYLHFSEPEEGPLSDFHTYMPDMMGMIVSGIKSGIPTVKEAMDELSSNMLPSYNYNHDAKSEQGSSRSIVINVYGAEGQSVEELADVLEQRLNHAVQEREAAFA